MSILFSLFSFTLRSVAEADVAGVFKLINVLAEYEGGSHLVTNTEQRLSEDLLGKNPLCGCIIAVEKSSKEIAGIALYHYCYSIRIGKCLYLEDFVMLPEYRKKGLGLGMFQCVSFVSKITSCKRIQWLCLDWNEPAIKFYKRIGGEKDNDLKMYRQDPSITEQFFVDVKGDITYDFCFYCFN